MGGARIGRRTSIPSEKGGLLRKGDRLVIAKEATGQEAWRVGRGGAREDEGGRGQVERGETEQGVHRVEARVETDGA